VLALIGPQLEGEDRTWLEMQCAPLAAEQGRWGGWRLGALLASLAILGPRVALNRGLDAGYSLAGWVSSFF
jgi:hypothetical protein